MDLHSLYGSIFYNDAFHKKLPLAKPLAKGNFSNKKQKNLIFIDAELRKRNTFKNSL